MSEIRDNLDARNLVTVLTKIADDGVRPLRPASKRLVWCELHEICAARIAECGPKRGPAGEP